MEQAMGQVEQNLVENTVSLHLHDHKANILTVWYVRLRSRSKASLLVPRLVI